MWKSIFALLALAAIVVARSNFTEPQFFGPQLHTDKACAEVAKVWRRMRAANLRRRPVCQKVCREGVGKTSCS
jgi:hypothetical protein